MDYNDSSKLVLTLDMAKKILSIINRISLGWTYTNLLLARKICDGGGTVESEWYSDWQQKYDKPPNIHKETSYDECVAGTLTLTGDNKLQLLLSIFDGNIVDGSPTTLRCKFTITFDEMFDELVTPLNRGITREAISIIEQEDRAARLIRIESTIKSLLI